MIQCVCEVLAKAKWMRYIAGYKRDKMEIIIDEKILSLALVIAAGIGVITGKKIYPKLKELTEDYHLLLNAVQDLRDKLIKLEKKKK